MVYANPDADGSVAYRTDPEWFTPYMRRNSVSWESAQTSLRKSG